MHDGRASLARRSGSGRVIPLRSPGVPVLSSTLIAQAGLVVLGVGGLIVLVAAIRTRRHRERLARIGSRHSLGLATGPCPPALLDRAGRFEGRDRKVSLADVMVGRGDSAGVFLARRKVGRHRHVLLGFELGSGSRLEGFFVRPARERRDAQPELSLQWRAPQSQWNDQRALSMAARAMYSLATVGDRPDARPLGMEIRGARVWIHSRRVLRGAALEHFVNDAMRLRALLLKSLERTNDIEQRSGRTPRFGASAPRELVRS